MSSTKPKRLPAAQRREQILTAARTLFANRGYGETTLDAIAAEVGVSRARVVQLFESKEGVYRAIAEDAYRSHPMDRDLIEPMERLDDRAVFEAYARHILEHTAQPEEREILKILTYARLREDSFHREHFEQKDSLMISRLTDYVAQRMADGALRPADPKVVVYAYQAMLFNLALYKHSLNRMDFVDNDSLAEECARIFTLGLGA